MARPKHENPTPAELAVLDVLWDHGPGTVRKVMDHLQEDPPRAYTSVMSLLNVMFDKGLVTRESAGRAFIYDAAVKRERTQRSMVGELLDRAFSGSASTMVTQLLAGSKPSTDELEQIRSVIDIYQDKKKGK